MRASGAPTGNSAAGTLASDPSLWSVIGMAPEQLSKETSDCHGRNPRPGGGRQPVRDVQRHRPDRTGAEHPRKVKDNEPCPRDFAHERLGAGWNQITKTTGEEHISVSFSAPELGTSSGGAGAGRGAKQEGHHIEPGEIQLRRHSTLRCTTRLRAGDNRMIARTNDCARLVLFL